MAGSSLEAARKLPFPETNACIPHSVAPPHRAQVTAQRLQHENDTLRRQLGDLCAKWVLQRGSEGGGRKSLCNAGAATGLGGKGPQVRRKVGAAMGSQGRGASHCTKWVLQRDPEKGAQVINKGRVEAEPSRPVQAVAVVPSSSVPLTPCLPPALGTATGTTRHLSSYPSLRPHLPQQPWRAPPPPPLLLRCPRSAALYPAPPLLDPMALHRGPCVLPVAVSELYWPRLRG